MTRSVLDATPASTRTVRRRLVVVAVAAAGVDLVSKVAASAFVPGSGVDLPGPLDLRLVHNPGIAFGLGDALPAWVLLLLTGALVAFLARAGWRGAFASAAAAGLVLGGAVANLVDRVQAGTVVDMLHLGWWPTFNLADVWITAGAVLLVLTEAHAGDRRARS